MLLLTIIKCKCCNIEIGRYSSNNKGAQFNRELLEEKMLSKHKQLPQAQQCPNFVKGGFANVALESIDTPEGKLR